MPEPAPHAAPERPDVPPYRVRAVYLDRRWHLAVESLNDHPDRGEVDSVVVSLEARDPGGAQPPAEIDGKLRECGFDRHGAWARHEDGWSAPCAQSDVRAAPSAPPVPRDAEPGRPGA